MTIAKILTGLMGILIIISCSNHKSYTASHVEIKQNNDGEYRFFVNGEEFFVKGAGLEFGDIPSLASHGGNSFRTWRTDNGKKSATEILDEAHANGVMVLMGLDIGRERHGFDYNDPVWVNEQFEYAKNEVLKYKDHPALLAWGIGNELNHDAENMKVWNAVNEISNMIHEIDPHHPTTTMLAGISEKEIDYIKAQCNDLDFISIQMYADIVNLQKRIQEADYEGPYLVTEWGATGHWEVPRTEWDVAIEQTSKQKAESIIDRYKNAVLNDPKYCMGSYVFLWGQKQERTPTWYGMFLENGNPTETVDAMHYLWNNKWPDKRAPTIDSLNLNGMNAYENVILERGKKYLAEAWGRCLENGNLLYHWEILPESTELNTGGDYEKRPATLKTYQKNPVTVEAPKKPGAYRIYVYITNPNRKSATGNIPFLVE